MIRLLYIFLATFIISCHIKEDSDISQPNILFILADDLGYSDLSCMGSSYYETPNIDDIAANGMVFIDGYAGCQVCSPSRATILSGQFTARHGITDWIGAYSGVKWREKKRHSQLLPSEYKLQLDTNLLTLPKALKAHGYTTFFAGKWHLGSEGSLPENHGFDINIGGLDKGSPPGGFFSPFRNPMLKDKYPGENLSIRLAEETSAFIEASKDKSFLAYLSFYAVHAPLQTTKKNWRKYRDKADSIGIEEVGFEAGHFLPMRKYQDNPIYAGLIETMDDAVGLVLKCLKENGLEENTIVIFTSDNGGVTSGDHYSTNCMPLKGGKGYEWEGGIRVPYIVKVPWINNKGVRSKTPVSGSDFYPTILDLAGLALHPEAHIDGQSIVPALKGQELHDRPLIWHYPHYGNQGGRPVSMIRVGDWKLIHFYEDGHNELYKVDIDLHEDHNLAQMLPDKVVDLSNTLFEYLEKVNAKKPISDPLYNKTLEEEIVAKMKINAIERLEKQRSDMLNVNWEPNASWWGSVCTED